MIFNLFGILFLFYTVLTLENVNRLIPFSYKYLEYQLGPSSILKVNGKTNINNFSCISQEKYPKNGFYYQFNPNTDIFIFEDATIKIPLRDLDCGGKAINKDFLKTLRADEFPFISIELKKAIRQDNDTPVNVDNSMLFMVTAEITITDKSKVVSIPICIFQHDAYSYRVTGSVHIQLSDFGIQPPKVFLGLISVKNDIDIQADLEVVLINEI